MTGKFRREIAGRIPIEWLESRMLLSGSYVAESLGVMTPANFEPAGGVISDAGGNLYGTTFAGGSAPGPTGDGTVFEVAAGTRAVTTLVTFTGANGQSPTSGLIFDSAGNMYGTTAFGGANNDGTVFEVTAGTHTLITLASFDGTDGLGPQGQLAFDTGGNLYGTATQGGTANDGTVFVCAAGNHGLFALASFTGTNGSEPQYGVVIDSSGNIFGTTSMGGANTKGTVFEIASGTATITTLVSFNTTNGSSPVGGLIVDSSGNVYGATAGGGTSSRGTVFKITASTHVFSTLVNFDTTAGNEPGGGLVFDPNGNLYGATRLGGANGNGTVYEIPVGTTTAIMLAPFIYPVSGGNPNFQLIIDGLGNLYGTNGGGGPFGVGSVFEIINPTPWIAPIATFNGAGNGSDPMAGLVADASGNLYGTDYNGGTAGDGTVFEVAAGTHALTTLATFSGANGANPDGSLIFDSAGNLYGTAYKGGDLTQNGGLGDGTVFEVTAGTHNLLTLATFEGANGAQPIGALTFDSSGNLYGNTCAGGATSAGTVFKITATTHVLSVVANFTMTNGRNPNGGMISDSAGNLYGTTWGGNFNGGEVFEVVAGADAITPIATFSQSAPSGQKLLTGLVADSAGNLYGTTSAGGTAGWGTVYEVAAGTHILSTLASFPGTPNSPSTPQGTLIFDGAGNLYGTSVYLSSLGGNGTVYELPAGSHTLTAIGIFNGADGANPYGNLVFDALGNLYGTAYSGGANNDGTVFELTAVNNSTVSGRVFEDINSDNLFTTNADTGFANVSLYLDINNVGSFVAGDPTTTADVLGKYSFTGLNSIMTGVVRLTNPPTGYYVATNAGATQFATPPGNTWVTNLAYFPIIFTGTSAADTYHVSAATGFFALTTIVANTIAYTARSTLLTSLTFNLGNGNDSINVDMTGLNPIPAGGLTIDGGAGTDSLTLTGPASSDTVSVNATQIVVNSSIINYANLEAISVITGAGNDSLTQTAQPGNGATLTFSNGTGQDYLNVTGGNFVIPSDPGGTFPDYLSVAVGGSTTPASITLAGNAAGVHGIRSYTFYNLSIENNGLVTMAPAASALDADRSNLTLYGFTLDGTGKLDIKTNSVDLFFLSVLNLQTAIASGAIFSSSSDAHHGVGYLNSPYNNPVPYEIRYTLLGDTNLDGTVNFTDLLALAQHYNSTVATWSTGDFTNDGTTNFADLLALAQNYVSVR